MNKIKRSFLKFSIINLLLTMLPVKSFSFEVKNKETKLYKKKFNGFIWHLNKKD